MAEATSAIPVGVYPYLTVKGGKAAIDFYTRAFGASEEYRAYGQDNERIMHARIRVNGFAILISDDFPEFHGGAEAPPPVASQFTSKSTTPTPGGNAPSTPAQKSKCRSPTNSGATATASSAIRSATAGRSARR